MSETTERFGVAIKSGNDVLIGAAMQGLSAAELDSLIAGLEMTADIADVVDDSRGTSITLVLLAAARRLRDRGDGPVDVMRELADQAPGFYDEGQEGKVSR